MPAAWKAVAENGQVYADWTGGTRIINRDKETG